MDSSEQMNEREFGCRTCSPRAATSRPRRTSRAHWRTRVQKHYLFFIWWLELESMIRASVERSDDVEMGSMERPPLELKWALI